MNKTYLWAECEAAIVRLATTGMRREVMAALAVHGAYKLADVPWRERRLLLRSLSGQHPSIQAVKLIAAGYRRISNKYGMVSRIDRPDYVEFMAVQMHRAPADFMLPGSRECTPGWEEHYRRCYSKDVLTLGQETGRMVPGFNGEKTGYVPKVDSDSAPKGKVVSRQATRGSDK